MLKQVNIRLEDTILEKIQKTGIKRTDFIVKATLFYLQNEIYLQQEPTASGDLLEKLEYLEKRLEGLEKSIKSIKNPSSSLEKPRKESRKPIEKSRTKPKNDSKRIYKKSLSRCPELLEVVREGFANGKTAKEIAAEIGYPPRTVQVYFSKLRAEE